AGVGEGFARSLVSQALRDLDGADEISIRRAVRALLAKKIPCAGATALEPSERRLVAFFGPTGVGKTTALAKLGATAHLEQGRRVGLVAADATRHGAVEQLRRCAQILGAPFKVAVTRESLKEALDSMRDADLVLIDTPGRSARDAEEIAALAALFE